LHKKEKKRGKKKRKSFRGRRWGGEHRVGESSASGSGHTSYIYIEGKKREKKKFRLFFLQSPESRTGTAMKGKKRRAFGEKEGGFSV